MSRFEIAYTIAQPTNQRWDLQSADVGDILDGVAIGDVTLEGGGAEIVLSKIPVLHFALELNFAVEKALFFGDMPWVSLTQTPHIAQVRCSAKQLELLLGGMVMSDDIVGFCRSCGLFMGTVLGSTLSDLPQLSRNSAFMSPLFRYVRSRVAIPE